MAPIQTDPPSELQAMMETSNAPYCWDDMPDGTRKRIWCRDCWRQGKDWWSPEPCSHILAARQIGEVSEEVRQNTLQALKDAAKEPGD